MNAVLPWIGMVLIAACAGAKAQSADAGKSVAAAIPAVQAGKWKLIITGKRGPKEEELCGDPLDGMRRELQEYAATTRWGCTMKAGASALRSAVIVYDCPSDRSPDGRPVSKGRTDISVVSPSPQAFRIEIKSTVYPGYVMEGTRIGECTK